ncbi:MAG: anti-sigma factor domain-containing protein [Gaiellaceae bacterium]
MRRRRADEANADETSDLAALADGALPPARRSVLEARVDASPELTVRLAEQQQARALVRDSVDGVEAPQALRKRIAAQGRAPNRFAPRRVVPAVAAAAAVAAVVIAVVASNTDDSGTRFAAALAPTNAVAGASGEASFTRTSSGWRIDFDANGLPRLAGGRFYEAWLRNPAGVLVPIGTFNEGRHVTLWAGVPPRAFTRLTVTRERADGDQRSSRDVVLAGPVTTRG